MAEPRGDLSVTALYTAQVWAWGGLPGASLFETADSKRVFDVTNLALGAAGLLHRSRAPLRQELLHRHTMIDHLVRDAGTMDVLELAAGLSRRGTAFSADADRCYTEVDLPPMIEAKRALLARTAAGREVLERPGFRLVGVDVETDALTPWVRPRRPLFVIAEGLVIYLSAPARRQLWAKIRALAELAGELRLVFDLTPGDEQPPAGLAGRALGAAMRRFTGGRGFDHVHRRRDEIRDDLLAAGFTSVTVIDSAAVARSWNLPYPDAQTRQVLFDCRA